MLVDGEAAGCTCGLLAFQSLFFIAFSPKYGYVDCPVPLVSRGQSASLRCLYDICLHDFAYELQGGVFPATFATMVMDGWMDGWMTSLNRPGDKVDW